MKGKLVTVSFCNVVSQPAQVDQLRKDTGEYFANIEDRMVEMKVQMDAMTLTTKLLEVDQKSPRDLPFILTCAYQDRWSTPSATITYDRLTVDYNNSGRPGGGDGEMNISTGKFTALTPGHYTVTYSGYAQVYPGEQVVLKLMKNGVRVGIEGWWQSYSSSNNGGASYDQGSRTVVSV